MYHHSMYAFLQLGSLVVGGTDPFILLQGFLIEEKTKMLLAKIFVALIFDLEKIRFIFKKLILWQIFIHSLYLESTI